MGNTDYLNTAEAAKLMGVSRKTVRELCRTGMLQGAIQEHEKGPWKIPSSSVEAWIAKHPNKRGGRQILTGANALRAAFFAVVLLVASIVSGLADLDLAIGKLQELEIWPTPNISDLCEQAEEESLLLVARFHGDKHEDPSEQIVEQLRDDIGDLELGNIILVELPMVMSTVEEARELGRACKAAIVIWGKYDQFSVTPYIEIIRKDNLAIGQVDLMEVVNLPSEPDRFSLYIAREMGQELSYLSLFSLAQMAYSYEDIAMSLDLFSKALEVKPEHTENDLNEAILYTYRGLIEQIHFNNPYAAIAEYNAALSFNPISPEILFNRGLAFKQSGEFELAAKDYAEAIELDDSLAEAHYELGDTLRILGQMEAALDEINRAIQLDEDYILAYLGRGFLYYQDGRWEDAIHDFSTVLLQNPSHPAALFNRGLSYHREGSLDAAIEDFSRLIDDDRYKSRRDRLEALLSRASVYVAQTFYEDAIADYKMSIALEPNSSKAYNELAWLYADTLEVELDYAIELATEAVRLAKANEEENELIVAYLDTLGWAYYKANEIRLASSTLREALALCINGCPYRVAIREHLREIVEKEP